MRVSLSFSRSSAIGHGAGARGRSSKGGRREVHGEALEADRAVVADAALDDPVLVELRAGALVGPDAGGIDGIDVDLALLEKASKALS
jgi:hypothetical protein